MAPDVRALYDQGEQAYYAGRFMGAREALTKAQALDSNQPLILSRLGDLALLDNRPDLAIGWYRQAQIHTPWYENVWPLNADLKRRLAMAEYRRDGFAEAARYFREAAGPIAIGPFSQLKALGTQAADLASAPAYVINGPHETRIPFAATDPLPVVPLSIDGQPPEFFLIDTGGAELILDLAYAQALGVEPVSVLTGSYGGQKAAETGLSRVDTVQLGDFEVANVPVHLLDLTTTAAAGFAKAPIKGILGTRLLMHFATTLDYPNGVLTLRRLDAESREALAQEAADEAAIAIPFWLAETHYLVARGTVNGQGPMLFLIDTGLAGQGFTATAELLQAAGITVDWSMATEGVGGGGTLKAAPIQIQRLTLGEGAHTVSAADLPGVAMEHSLAVLGNTLGFELRGLVAHQFFRNHVLTLDFQQMRLIVK